MEPTVISFEEALRLAEELLLDLEDEGETEELKSQLLSILSTLPSCRGFFVTYLTGDSGLADDPPPYIIAAFDESEHVPELLAKNLVMSSSMYLQHERNGDQNNAAGSAKVRDRSQEIIKRLKNPAMRSKLQEMRFSIRSKTGIHAEFLRRWNYDEEQLLAASKLIESLL